MPTVPRYSDRQITQQQALPNVRVQTDLPDGAYGLGPASQRVTDAAQNLGNTVHKFIMDEREKADDLMTQKAWAELTTRSNNLMYDSKEGAMTRKGEAAFGVVDEYGARFDKDAEDISQNMLKNDRQRQIFEQIRLRKRTEFHQNLERHTFTERERFQEEVLQTGLSTAKEDAVLNYQNPGKIQESITMQKALLQSQIPAKGKDWYEAETKRVESQTHTAVIGRMLANGQDMLASQYFKENKEAFSGQDVARVENSLKEGTLLGESQRQTDAIIQKTGSLQQALQMAKSIEDPKLRDAVSSRVRDEFSLRKAAETDARERIFQGMTNVLEQNGGDIDSLRRTQHDKWTLLPMAERKALEDWARMKREGTPPSTDWDLYYELKTRASSDATKGGFLTENLKLYRAKLADTEFKELVSLQSSMRTGDSKSNEILSGYRTHSQIVNDTLSAAGFDPSPKAGKEEARKVNLFRRKVDEEIITLQTKTGKKATSEDVQRIVDNLTAKVITKPGIFWDTKKRVFELEANETFAIDVKDIPRGERLKIEEALRSNAVPITDDAIVDLYNRKLDGMK